MKVIPQQDLVDVLDLALKTISDMGGHADAREKLKAMRDRVAAPDPAPLPHEGYYRHFEGYTYLALGEFEHCAGGEKVVAYRKDGKSLGWYRVVDNFDESTLGRKAWVKRFEYLGPAVAVAAPAGGSVPVGPVTFKLTPSVLEPVPDLETDEGDPEAGCGCGEDCTRSPGDLCPLEQLHALAARRGADVDADAVRELWREEGFNGTWSKLSALNKGDRVLR